MIVRTNDVAVIRVLTIESQNVLFWLIELYISHIKQQKCYVKMRNLVFQFEP